MFKTIITAIALTLTAVSAQAKLYMYEGSDWFWNDVHEAHVETINFLSNTKVRVLDDGKSYFLMLNGKITTGITPKIEEMIKEIRSANKGRGYNYAVTLMLHSNGGSASEGMKLGRMLRRNSVHTKLVGDMECWSACADAFIGGLYRTIKSKAKVVVHAPYTNGKFGTSTCVTQFSEEAKVFKVYADDMLGAQSNIYNNKSFICNTAGGHEIKANHSWIQND